MAAKLKPQPAQRAAEHWTVSSWPTNKRSVPLLGLRTGTIMLQQLVKVDLFPSSKPDNIFPLLSLMCAEREAFTTGTVKQRRFVWSSFAPGCRRASFQVLLSLAAFWSQKPFLLLCDDASSPCQFYFNALIDVTSLIARYNLKWAFNHSYWNIDVRAVYLNPSLQGAVFFAAISEDNFANPRATQAWNRSSSTNMEFPQAPRIKDWHTTWYSGLAHFYRENDTGDAVTVRYPARRCRKFFGKFKPAIHSI